MHRGDRNSWGCRLIHRVGHRGASLLFFALLDAVYSFSLFNPPPEAQVSRTIAFMRDVAPLQFWGGLWAVVGLICFICAFRTDDRWGFTAAMLIKVLWGCLYVYGAFTGVDRAYLSAAIWLCLAGWVAIISSWPPPTNAE